MTYVKSKSKFDNSKCAYEGCAATFGKDADYIYDTEGKKAYCLGHDDINSKVVENKGGGGKFQSSKLKLEKVSEIFGKSEELLEAFKNKRVSKNEKLTIGEEATFVESMFKTISGSYKE